MTSRHENLLVVETDQRELSTLWRRPGPVWGATKAVPYPDDGVERDATIAKFKDEIAKYISF